MCVRISKNGCWDSRTREERGQRRHLVASLELWAAFGLTSLARLTSTEWTPTEPLPYASPRTSFFLWLESSWSWPCLGRGGSRSAASWTRSPSMAGAELLYAQSLVDTIICCCFWRGKSLWGLAAFLRSYCSWISQSCGQ